MNWKALKLNIENTSKTLIASTAVMTKDISTFISQADFFKKLNEYSSEVSKSMDENFIGKINKSMFPSNHRIVDGGHDFFTTIDKAQEIGIQEGWDSTTTFTEWAKSYFSDLSSNAGMPVFGKFSDEIYHFLKSINISEENARDFVTVNGQEALDAIFSGTVSVLALLFGWKNQDKEVFSKAVGSILCASTVTMNPASLIIALIALGFGYNKLVCKETVARGAIVTSVGMVVSAIIPGPVLLGLIPALLASIYIHKKMGADFKPIEYSAQIFLLLKSDDFKKTCLEIYDKFIERSKQDDSIAS